MLSMNSYAGVSVVGWGGHYHPHGGYGPGPYWGGGGGFFFGGGGWAGPNVVINIPAEPYYAPPPPPVCRTVEVCDPYDECWIERQCA